jgi:GT2 family glycosyltransferase
LRAGAERQASSAHELSTVGKGGKRADSRLGIVVIGRNEGARLEACLDSVAGRAADVVYVDSGSTDNSVVRARDLGAAVVELDPRVPFTAARARNEGFAYLQRLAPAVRYVQFVDGDCQLAKGWLDAGAHFLDGHPEVAAVCGRRRERYPERSVYNLLCDLEWDTPLGEARACGGDVMMRVTALAAVRGFRSSLIAGEEPELCFRLRAAGWRIWRLDHEMTLHDAAMTRFGQWWRRTVRAGHAFAEGAYLHGASRERHGVRESLSAWFWAIGLPLAAAAAGVGAGAWALLLLLAYPLQVIRLGLRGQHSARENWWYAVFLILAKFPESVGQIKFLVSRLRRSEPRLIEYK